MAFIIQPLVFVRILTVKGDCRFRQKDVPDFRCATIFGVYLLIRDPRLRHSRTSLVRQKIMPDLRCAARETRGDQRRMSEWPDGV
jgi:hypothetical protein